MGMVRQLYHMKLKQKFILRALWPDAKKFPHYIYGIVYVNLLFVQLLWGRTLCFVSVYSGLETSGSHSAVMFHNLPHTPPQVLSESHT